MSSSRRVSSLPGCCSPLAENGRKEGAPAHPGATYFSYTLSLLRSQQHSVQLGTESVGRRRLAGRRLYSRLQGHSDAYIHVFIPDGPARRRSSQTSHNKQKDGTGGLMLCVLLLVILRNIRHEYILYRCGSFFVHHMV
jgi:hypothetical protein